MINGMKIIQPWNRLLACTFLVGKSIQDNSCLKQNMANPTLDKHNRYQMDNFQSHNQNPNYRSIHCICTAEGFLDHWPVRPGKICQNMFWGEYYFHVWAISA